jgi:excisionase family DNA binding protein
MDDSLLANGDRGTELADDSFLREVQLETTREAERLGCQGSVDLWFATFLRRFSRFGYFTFGPITIDVRLIQDIAERIATGGTPRREGPVRYGEDWVRFSILIADQVRRSGQSRVDELHVLLALMRYGEGLPGRVFGELGVTAEQVERYAHSRRDRADGPERLYSPEEAAEYLGVHVQTVRAWIRSGRLRARRLAGQRALRISASDLEAVLEPLSPGED